MIIRLVREMRSEGFEIDPMLLTHLENMYLTNEQIELVLGIAHRIAATEENRLDMSRKEFALARDFYELRKVHVKAEINGFTDDDGEKR